METKKNFFIFWSTVQFHSIILSVTFYRLDCGWRTFRGYLLLLFNYLPKGGGLRIVRPISSVSNFSLFFFLLLFCRLIVWSYQQGALRIVSLGRQRSVKMPNLFFFFFFNFPLPSSLSFLFPSSIVILFVLFCYSFLKKEAPSHITHPSTSFSSAV